MPNEDLNFQVGGQWYCEDCGVHHSGAEANECARSVKLRPVSQEPHTRNREQPSEQEEKKMDRTDQSYYNELERADQIPSDDFEKEAAEFLVTHEKDIVDTSPYFKVMADFARLKVEQREKQIVEELDWYILELHPEHREPIRGIMNYLEDLRSK